MERIGTSKGFHYDLAIDGIWGRNRTAKFTSVKVAESAAPAEGEDLAAIIAKAHEAVAKYKIKPGSRLAIYEAPVETTEYSDGTKMVSRVLFTDKRIFEMVVA